MATINMTEEVFAGTRALQTDVKDRRSEKNSKPLGHGKSASTMPSSYTTSPSPVSCPFLRTRGMYVEVMPVFG